MAICPYCGSVEEDSVVCSNCGNIMIKGDEWEREGRGLQELCPRCREGVLILRYSRIGLPFYGCSNYPDCRYTRGIRLTKKFEKKKFEKEDEFIQWLQKKGLESTTINTYVTAASQYAAFLQEDKTGKAWQKTAVISRKPSEAAVKDKNDPYPHLTIEEIVRIKLLPLLKSGRVVAAEIQELTDSQYCKQVFDLDYPLLSKSCRYDSQENPLYYKDSIWIKGEKFYVCSKWSETHVNNNRPYLLRWLQEYSVPESVQSSPSSDTDIIAASAESTSPETAEKNTHDSYPHLTIEQIVSSKLWPLLETGQVDAAEIQKLTDSQYCKQKFDLDCPLLSKSCRYNSLGTSLCYKKRICINGEYFYVCSQWFESPTNNDRPYLLRWMREYSVPETIQSSPSSDTDIIAARTESTSPKTVFVNVNSRVAAPAEKANPEPVQAEQHDDSRTADLLFLEDAMQRIKECIARNGDVLSVKCARGYTPLMVAAQCDDADVLTVIIAKMKEANGNFEQRNDEGKTAYIVARESRAEKAMSLLKEAGARTDAAIIIARRKTSAAEQNNCEKK